MDQLLLFFYVLFFATGFMGGAALFLLDMRVRSTLLKPLLLFQLLFLFGMGLIVGYYYGATQPGGLNPRAEAAILLILQAINGAVYGIVVVLVRRITPPAALRSRPARTAQALAGLVVIKSGANIAVLSAAAGGVSGMELLAGASAWHLGGHLLSAMAMVFFGLVARGRLSPKEPPALRRLTRAYGLCAIIFAPIGLIEYAVSVAGWPWLTSISLDHFFYLTWNIVSMSAAIRLFRPVEGGTPMLEAVPEERVKALGLSAREAEMAIMIARGLANKEIAAELNISPATVRTHIYNLYQKADARSRVELLNKLRS
jgi:DNA-binding CsgD family transcriptional regulator